MSGPSQSEERARGGYQRPNLWTALITGLISQQVSDDPGGDRWAGLLATIVPF
jgi:hypothetical protein